ncbi:hypothetical protein [uncultured Modestobacter sp.]|uniref:hypothetical protein n=1 Tax=uncultured Modestobacter sp. TaxID=380048 RepID=UPI0026062A53|nr:hypothetical protein [uncultured Modestobacter sp.]
MPSTSSRRRGPAAPQHRPRRPIGRGFATAPPAPVRPVQAPFAAVFGLLVAAEDAYLGWLLWDADPGWGWYLLLPALLAVAAVAGAVLVHRGRALGRVSGSAVLATACVLPMLGLLGLALFFAALGGGQAAWWALLLLIGPVGGLVLALQQPVRQWSAARPARSGAGAR